ncbi:MAG: MFS transporter, partial [Candidatus Poribacteria bacterium]
MPTSRYDRPALRVTLLVVSSLTVMAGATIMPALPAMREHFSDVRGAEMWVSLVLTMPALFIVLWAPVAGVIVDRYGRKRLLVASVVLYAVAGGSGCVADSL